MDSVKRSGKLKIVGSQFKNSINYELSNINESMQFVQDVAHKIQIWNLVIAGKGVAQMREEVKFHLTAEEEIDQLNEFISEESTWSEVMKQIICYVPCIMHCENRGGIKIFETLLMEGLSNAQGDFLPEHTGDTIVKRETAYIKGVEDFLNTSTLGSEGNMTQYQVLLEKKGKATKNIRVLHTENYRMRRVSDKLDHIVNMSVIHSDKDE